MSASETGNPVPQCQEGELTPDEFGVRARTYVDAPGAKEIGVSEAVRPPLRREGQFHTEPGKSARRLLVVLAPGIGKDGRMGAAP